MSSNLQLYCLYAVQCLGVGKPTTLRTEAIQAVAPSMERLRTWQLVVLSVTQMCNSVLVAKPL